MTKKVRAPREQLELPFDDQVKSLPEIDLQTGELNPNIPSERSQSGPEIVNSGSIIQDVMKITFSKQLNNDCRDDFEVEVDLKNSEIEIVNSVCGGVISIGGYDSLVELQSLIHKALAVMKQKQSQL